MFVSLSLMNDAVEPQHAVVLDSSGQHCPRSIDSIRTYSESIRRYCECHTVRPQFFPVAD